MELPKEKIHHESYLKGEENATEACGRAIKEAHKAVEKFIKNQPTEFKVFILEELMGIAYRATEIMIQKNNTLGIKTPVFNPANEWNPKKN